MLVETNDRSKTLLLALALGVTTLELDTAVTADDVVVVSHDTLLNPNFTRDADGRWLAAPGPELLSLITNRDRPGSLAYALARAALAAQAVREQLSLDTWRVLGNLDDVLDELAGSAPEASDLPGALSRVLQGLLALAGLAAESLVRDSGWCLLDAGRRIERAQHVTSLIAATLCDRTRPGTDALVTESVLIAEESVITFRRRRRTGPDAVLELLLTDRTNPRAVAYQIERLRSDVAGIPGPRGSGDAVEPALAAVERRLAGIRPPLLARRDPAGARAGLQSVTGRLSTELLRFADVLEQDRFAPDAPQHTLGPAVAVS